MKTTEFCDATLPIPSYTASYLTKPSFLFAFVLERRERGRGSRDTHYILQRGGGTEKILALKFPTQCPLALLVEVCWTEGKAMGSGPCYEYKTEVAQGLYCAVSEFSY
jgi:hypothetical protein